MTAPPMGHRIISHTKSVVFGKSHLCKYLLRPTLNLLSQSIPVNKAFTPNLTVFRRFGDSRAFNGKLDLFACCSRPQRPYSLHDKTIEFSQIDSQDKTPPTGFARFFGGQLFSMRSTRK
jgi:hypothetical protein